MADETASASALEAGIDPPDPMIGNPPGYDPAPGDGENRHAGNHDPAPDDGGKKSAGNHDPAPDEGDKRPGGGEPGKEGDGGGEKPAGPGPKAPQDYTAFSVPEGTMLDEQSATEFKGLAKELDLTQEQAQKLLDFGGGKIRNMTDAPYRLWAETQEKWQAEVKADPEIGGTRYKDSIAAANNVFVPGESNPFVKNAQEADALRVALNMTGAGNNPTMVRLFVKMGKMLSEPGSLTGNPLRDTQDSLLAKMYPTMGPNE